MPPPTPVVQAFTAGASVPIVDEAVPGGEGSSWRVDDVVIKAVHDSAEAEWCQAVLAHVVEDGFRRPEPIPSADGRFVVDGWIASRYIDGLRDGRPRWREIVHAGIAFHRALSDVDVTGPVLARRQHRWAVADRVAWGETTVELSAELLAVYRRFAGRLEPLALGTQLIHGDLGGNVMFDTDDTPVVIDFSPYVRPVRYATAIVACDALLWEGAGPEVLDLVGFDDVGRQLVLRAAIFRLSRTRSRSARGTSASWSRTAEYSTRSESRDQVAWASTITAAASLGGVCSVSMTTSA